MLQPVTEPEPSYRSRYVCKPKQDVMILAQAPQLAGMQDLGQTAAAFVAGNSTELAHHIS